VNIILISDLYPAYAGHSIKDVSYALHYFVRQWIKTENVLVIKPYVFTGKNWHNLKLKSKEFMLDGVRIIHCPVIKIPKLKIFCLSSLYKIIDKEINPDIVVAHLGFNLIFGYKVAKHYQLPLISAVHKGDFRFGFNMLSENFLRDIFSHSFGIACRSYPLYERFIKWLPKLQERCFVAYSGIDRNIILTKNFAIKKAEKWINSKKIKFISVCHLIESKNIDINLNALSNLNGQLDWIYKIIGDGKERRKLQKLTEHLGISNKGLAYLEAMATGNIVIGAKGEGIDGVVENGKNGFLCTPRDKKELAQTLEHIITGSSKKELEDIVTHSRETILNYTEEKAAKNYLGNIIKFCKK
jgi:glycosyltransferase involved in cell wall biosynthesis